MSNVKYDYNNINRQAHSIIRIINWIVGKLLSTEDTVSLQTAEYIYTSTPFMRDTFNEVFEEITAIRMVHCIMNLAMVTYQYLYATWFMYLFSTRSGLMKIYHCVFKNPVYGILFFSTFYCSFIRNTADQVKFDRVAEFLKMPAYSVVAGDISNITYAEKIVNTLPETFAGFHTLEYKSVVVNTLGLIVSSVPKKIIDLPDVLRKVYTSREFKEVIKPIPKSKLAVYYIARDEISFDDRDVRDMLEYIKDQHALKKQVKSLVKNPKNKAEKKRVKKSLVERTDDQGRKICLNACKPRIKTASGCTCESECGTSTVLGGRDWCYIDPEKCKKGKHRSEGILGKKYDYCDPEKTSASKTCFTGIGYEECGTE